MAQVFRDPDGNFVAIKEDGTQVPVMPNLAANARISGFAPIKQEQGVSLGQRFVVKNLASNPDAAKAYLEGVGYDVRPYGGGFNFAVRPKMATGRTPWKVVDPDGFDPQDLLDLAGDAVSLGAQTAAAVGVAPSLAAGPAGLAAEAGVVGATSGAVEAGRQAIGSMVGVPNNLDPKQIGIQAGAGAAGSVIGRGVGAAARNTASFISRTARSAGARFAGIEGSRALPGADALLDAANWAVDNPRDLMKTPKEAADILRGAVQKIARDPFPERALTQQMAEDAGQMGVSVNIRPTWEAMQNEIPLEGSMDTPFGPTQMTGTPEEAAKHGAEPSLRDNLNRTMATMYSILRDENLTGVSPERAITLKNYLQTIAMQKGAYTQTPPGRAFRNIVSKAAAEVKSALEDAMTNGGFNTYVPTMRAFELKTKMLHDWSKVLRVKDGSAMAQTARENFVRALYSDSKTNYLSGLDDLESTFGVSGLKAAVREARVGSMTGMNTPEGPSLLGRGARSTLGLGALVFGHPAVAATELAATSPRVVMAATKAGVRASRLLSGVTGPATKAGSLLVTQEAGKAIGKGVARDDAAPKRTRIGV